MSNDADLAYLRSVAESGQSAPPLGGRFFLWWGGLAAVALLAHWAVLVGLIGIGAQNVGLIWMAYGLVGLVGSVLLGRTLQGKPGAGAASNRGERAVWTGATGTIFAYAIGLVIAAATGRITDPVLFDTIPLVAFGCYGISFWVVAMLGGPGWLKAMAALAWLASLAGASLLGTPALYLYAAAVVGLLALMPGLVLMRGEPKGVHD